MDDGSTRDTDQEAAAGEEDIAYRFPYSRTLIEPAADIGGAFAVRVAWQRGKAVLPVFETTALRPIAQVTLAGQKFPVFLTQHSRKRRDRIVLAGRRKTSRSARCALRFIAIVEGREDRLVWTWRIGATAAAVAAATDSAADSGAEAAASDVVLYLPFAPGKPVILTEPDIETPALTVWINDVAVSVLPSSETRGARGTPELTTDGRNVVLTLRDANLGGEGVTVRWETWLAPARTETDARNALLRHLADAADRSQTGEAILPGFLARVGDEAEATLLRDDLVAKRGVDRVAYRGGNGINGIPGPALHVIGERTDTAMAAAALLARYALSGDDLLQRRARLLARGVCDFQVTTDVSSHWGAFWDAQNTKTKQFCDLHGEPILSVATTARAARGLSLTYNQFGTEVMKRAALAATQWLLLKMDRLGHIVAERFTEEGPPVEPVGSPWVMCEAIIPFLEAFRTAKNEVFMKAALRIADALKDGLADGGALTFPRASTEQIAAAIEGVLEISREYESTELVTLARQIGVGLRVRRAPDGHILEPDGRTPISPMAPTLAAARAALALARVDSDPLWPLFALRAVRAATLAAADEERTLADSAALASLSTGVLLAITGRASGCVPDRDRVSVTRGWQTFKPDPATREFIRVTAAGTDEPVDYLPLVCPISLQVLISVVAPPHVTQVNIVKNNRVPYVKDLLTGDFDLAAPLTPLGSRPDAMIGVFQADT